MRRALLALMVLAALWGAFTLSTPGRSAEGDQGVVADFISRALSTPQNEVSIGAVDGALSSDVTIRDVTIADRDGVWLRLDRARLVWRRAALFQRRLEIDRLEVGTLDYVRPKVATTGPVSDAPLLPELPLKVDIQAFALKELVLGAPVVGVPARLAATGSATLGNPSEGLDLRLDAKRLDAGGQATVRLRLVPDNQRLELALQVQEPAGGLLVRAGNVPGLPPVKLDLNGSGTLDAFDAKLAFDAGEAARAAGTARLTRENATRRLALALSGQFEGILPDAAASVFAGDTRLDGDLVFSDDGSLLLKRFDLSSRNARLAATGSLSSGEIADLKVEAATIPGSDGRTKLGPADIGRFSFDGRVSGPIKAPRVVADLAVEDARTPIGRLAKLDAAVTATPNGPLSEPATRVALALTAHAEGLAPEDAALARALGGTLDATVRGQVAPNGAGDYETIRLATPTATFAYAGRLGPAEARGRLQADIPDLARFSAVAGRTLSGAAKVAADIEGNPGERRLNARLDGEATRLSTGNAAVDGLIGGRLTLNGTARTLKDGFGFDKLRVEGRHVTAEADGAVTPAGADLKARVAIPDLKYADERLTGAAELTADVTGTLRTPDATARIVVTNATALGRPIPRLALDVTARDLTGALDLRATLDGLVDRKPATGSFHLARAGADYTIDDLAIAIGSVGVKGGVSIGAGGLAKGRLTVKAGDLDDLSPLLLTRLKGRLDADLILDAVNGRQDARLTARGEKLRAEGATLDRVDAEAVVKDLWGKPVIDAEVAVDRALVGGQTIERVKLTAKGSPEASDIALTARADGFDLDARGRLVASEPLRFELAAFAAQRGKKRIALAGPATLTLASDGVAVQNFTLDLDGGRFTVEGRVGTDLDVTFTARGVPLATGEIVAPSLDLAGTLDGEAHVEGTPDAPTGDYRLRVSGFSAPQTRAAGLPALDAAASGRLQGTKATVDATVKAGRAAALRVTGTVPFAPDAALDLDVKADNVPLGLISLGGPNDKLAGTLSGAAKVKGTLDAPTGDYRVRVANLVAPQTRAAGLPALDIAADGRLEGRRATVDATIRAGRAATLRVTGAVPFAPDAALDLNVKADNIPLSLVAVGGPQDRLAGTLNGEARVAGTLQAPTGDYRVRVRNLVAPQTRSAGLPALDIDANGRLERDRATVDAEIRGGRAASLRVTGSVPFASDGPLDLAARGRLDAGIANAQLAAGGRRLTGEVAVDLRAGGTPARPRVDGALTLAKGSFTDTIAGVRLDGLQARIVARGDDLVIERASATTRNGGTLTATGQARISPEAGFPGTIRLTGRRAELVSSDIATLVANLDLTLSGPLARNPAVTGRVDVASLDVTVPGGFGGAAQPLANARHVKPTPTAAARLAIAAKKRGNDGRRGRRGPPPFDARLDLVIAAPNAVSVHGRGLDAQLGGEVRLTGTLANPRPVGAFNLVRGRFDLLGQRLDLARGSLTFSGDLVPEIDFLAQAERGGVRAGIAVTGLASRPNFAFTSDPDLPQDEILSRILFARPSGSLSGFQALQVAAAAAQFSGGGDGAFEKLRRDLGLKGLDVGFGAQGPTIGFSRALSDRVSVGVKAGTATKETGATVDVDVTKRVRIQGEVGPGGAALGVGAEWEY